MTKNKRPLVGIAVVAIVIAIAGQGIAQDDVGNADDISQTSLDPGRIVQLDYLQAYGLPEAVENFAATPEELAASTARLEFVTLQNDELLLEEIRDQLGEDGYGGAWLGFDGALNIAHTEGHRPNVADLPAADSITYALHQREYSLADAELLAKTRNEIYNPRNASFAPIDDGPGGDDGPTNTRHYANRSAGLEIGLDCDGGGSAMWGFTVHYQDGLGQDKFGLLTAGHVLWSPSGGIGTCDHTDLGGGRWKIVPDPGTGHRVDVYQDADSSTRKTFGNKIYRGLYESTGSNRIVDAAVVTGDFTTPERRNTFHLAGWVLPNSTGGNEPYPDDYQQHGIELDEVWGGFLARDMTLCMPLAAQAQGVKCGYYEGPDADNAHEIGFIGGGPLPDEGDSGTGVIAPQSVSAGGPIAVGVYFGHYGWIDVDYLFYPVTTILVELGSEFSLFTGDLEVCTEGADGSWDFDCDNLP